MNPDEIEINRIRQRPAELEDENGLSISDKMTDREATDVYTEFLKTL